MIPLVPHRLAYKGELGVKMMSSSVPYLIEGNTWGLSSSSSLR